MMILSDGAEAAPGNDVVARSGPARVTLIELFSSEGCSSCPPAEKWLGELRNSADLWRTFVPVAFHVNYWDHLGWRDALASKAYTEREYAYADAWRASSVYTPCFVRNGQEWRPRDTAAAQAEAGANDAGMLTLTWHPATSTGRVEFVPAAGARAQIVRLEASIALLGGGIVSDVRQGENAGRKLRHEFVVLQMETVALSRNEHGAWSAAFSLPPRTDIATTRHGIAAWVSAKGQLAPIQAAGAWIDDRGR